MHKLMCILSCVALLLSMAAVVGAAEPVEILEAMEARFGPVAPVSAENSVVRASITFENVKEPLDCTLRWYINDTLCKEEFHFRLENGAVSELVCSVHFENDTPAESVLWVELTCNTGHEKAVFRQTLETKPIEAAAEPDADSYIVHVLRNQCVVIVYEKEESGEPGRVVNVFVCSPGRNNWTITGHYGAYDREVWLSLMGGVSGHYATLIRGDFLFHSVPYRGSWNHLLKAAEYNKLGEPASEGCIRMAVSDAKWLFENCVYGTEVYLFDSEILPVEKPVSIQINLDSPHTGWDPTDPHPDNPTKAGRIPEENGVITLPDRGRVLPIRFY